MSRYYKRAQNIGWFVIEVDTTIAGTTGVGNFEFRVAGTCNFNIVWGDGTMDRNVTANITHNYPSAGIYKVAVVGVLPQVFYNTFGDRLKVKKVLSWGDIVWSNDQSRAFRRCALTEIAHPNQSLNNITIGLLTFTQNFLSSLPSAMTLPLLSDGRNMFQENLLTDLPAGMTLPNLINGTSMFQDNTINTTRYSQLLVDMDANNQNTNVPFHGGNSTYTGAAAIAARANLVNVKGWNIIDGGQV